MEILKSKLFMFIISKYFIFNANTSFKFDQLCALKKCKLQLINQAPPLKTQTSTRIETRLNNNSLTLH